MGPIDYAVILIIALIVGGASFYIYRAKRSGQKCIGCPHSKSCHGCNGGCGCHSTSNSECNSSDGCEK